MSEDEYDVFTTNNYHNKIALERQGYDQSRIDLYMAFSGYALQAVPVGDELGNSKILYRVNIKKREYGEIGNLNRLDHQALNVLASTLISSFNGNTGKYELLVRSEATYIMFDCKSAIGEFERRFATIMNGKMTYIFVTVANEDDQFKACEDLFTIVKEIEW